MKNKVNEKKTYFVVSALLVWAAVATVMQFKAEQEARYWHNRCVELMAEKGTE